MATAQKTAALKVPILPQTSPEAPQPKSLKIPLYPHQLRACKFIFVLSTLSLFCEIVLLYCKNDGAPSNNLFA